jgi:hypothetical protein
MRHLMAEWVINYEQWERSFLGLIWGIYRYLFGGTEENRGNPQSEYRSPSREFNLDLSYSKYEWYPLDSDKQDSVLESPIKSVYHFKLRLRIYSTWDYKARFSTKINQICCFASLHWFQGYITNLALNTWSFQDSISFYTEPYLTVFVVSRNGR